MNFSNCSLPSLQIAFGVHIAPFGIIELVTNGTNVSITLAIVCILCTVKQAWKLDYLPEQDPS